jgi:hypothetical protein
MQIAGSKCRVCGSNITLSTEGKYCPQCGTYVHLACAPKHTCGECGQPFERYEPPTPDPLREGILPRALRPSRSGGLVMAAGLILLLAFLVFIFYWGFLDMISRGH